MELTTTELAKYIDLTLLKPDATPAQIEDLCEQAIDLGTFAVCVNPCHVQLASIMLHGSKVLPITVIGFPLGSNMTEVKVFEAETAICFGAREIDLVMNVGYFLSDAAHVKYAAYEIGRIVLACGDIPVKVILETALLSGQQIRDACLIAEMAGARFVKTSTGFCGPTQYSPTGGATLAAIDTMKATVGGRLGIKASGGIHNRANALAMIAAGATRIGASNARAILAK